MPQDTLATALYSALRSLSCLHSHEIFYTIHSRSTSLPSWGGAFGFDVEELAARYRERGKSDNTERTYKTHINHYRYVWGGFLPAGEDAVCRYLATYAQSLKVSTLRQRLSALSKWHKQQGFSIRLPAPRSNRP